MSQHFILIHGAWHGGWCWQGVINELSKLGFTAEAPTMPGHRPDDDRSNITLNDYLIAISHCLQKEEKPVILVGHSSAGFLLQSLAVQNRGKIEQIVYNNAFLLPNGKCQFDMVPPDVSEGMIAAAKESSDNSVPVTEDFVRGALMAGEPKETQDRLLAKLVPQPLALFTTPVDTSGYEDLNIPNKVVFCNKDVSLPEGAYLGMAQVLGEFSLTEVPLCHEGLFSQPEVFTKSLIEVLSK